MITHELDDANFTLLAESIPHMVWIADANDRVYYLNRRWFAYTGMTFEESCGTGYLSAIHPEDLANISEQSYLSDGGVRQGALESCASIVTNEITVRIKNSEGIYRWFLARGVALLGKDGEVTRRLGTSTDIENQKQVESDLKEAKRLAERANEAKSAFLANMSHEIRTPIAVMMGFCELLKTAGLNETQRTSYADSILRNGRHLSNLINDILDLSKIEAEKLKPVHQAFDPHDLLRDVLSSLRILATEKGLTLIGPPYLPDRPLLFSDPMIIRQVLMNIIGNALKFTERGTVVVTCGSLQSEGRDFFAFDVRDTGSGIPELAKEKLFQPFSQVDDSRTRTYGGTGLGLVLSKKLCEALGGDVILLGSEEGTGSTFRITVEKGLEEAQPPAPIKDDPWSQRMPSDRLAGLTILVVEDVPDNQFIVRNFLESEGAEVEVANNGLEAVEHAGLERFDVILMDIQMPVLDGFDATRRLRAGGFHRPIIALTAYAMPEDRDLCLAAGCSDRLTKPIRSAHLITSVLGNLSDQNLE